MLKLFAALAIAVPVTAIAQEFKVDPKLVNACFNEVPRDLIDAPCIGNAAEACSATTEQGETTLGISQCKMAETKAWDDLLNGEYKTLRKNYADQPELQKGLQAAQRAWIAFRDADCKFAYDVWGDGSIRQIVGADCQLRHTAHRAAELKNMRND
ncbi:lysozyme inhibitor LprI family protein [Paracoccus aestuariivivens]|uniref:DUF1311 domain-containing protein n=1 Tax=Paracoccus aestuariivivens TaxID=1820333 RepID=A0A6L6JHA4_9RHOB|nr:lysozyme inhibitor LprI family protein [Paracoccus aestuariivivens]MTH79534.1 DUF1311 domain-containing protein [Paracoccus aestuariivivens]